MNGCWRQWRKKAAGLQNYPADSEPGKLAAGAKRGKYEAVPSAGKCSCLQAQKNHATEVNRGYTYGCQEVTGKRDYNVIDQ